MKMASRMTGRRDARQQIQDGPQLDVRVVRSNKVFKTHKGGKTASWSVLVVVGDNKGMVGVGLGKANEVPDAIRKGNEQAKKALFRVPLVGRTIPHTVHGHSGAGRVFLRPASNGTGVIAYSPLQSGLLTGAFTTERARGLGAGDWRGTHPDFTTGLEANLRFAGPETMETRIFGRLTAWQNWIFQRPNAVGARGALTMYGQPERAEFDWRRT